MARLNETTAAAEPIEILKRRFVRQNREIARVNSIQSLRIRSLESEVSHLLSENVSLREQIITLTQEVERFEAAKTLRDGVYDIKTRLDSKLTELGGLVAELGSLPRQYTRDTRERPEPTRERPFRPSASIDQASGACVEPNAGLEPDGRLPAILEDKYYPRRTLEAQELQQLSNNTEAPSSPEVGASATPQRLPTEYDEPQTTESADIIGTNTLGGYTEDEPSLPPTLETRRKKKTYSGMLTEEHIYREPTSLLDSKFLRKCGAKRKFSTEDEENSVNSESPEDDGFEFSRPTHSPVKKQSPIDHSPTKMRPQPAAMATSHGQPKRKVLEPKSTNANLPSPTKPSVTTGSDQSRNPVVPGRDENTYQSHEKWDNHPREPIVFEYPKEMDGKHESGELKVDINLDVPPLQDNGHKVQAAAELTSTRPSRRQRAAVSYVEPNLRDKMRRSTNELAPAVGSDRSRKSTSHMDASREAHGQRSRQSAAKKARNSSEANGERDSITIEGTAENPKRQMNMISQRKRKTSRLLIEGDEENKLEGQSPGESEEPEEHATASAPQDKPQTFVSRSSDVSTDVEQTASNAGKKSRRHSSNPRASGRSTASKFSTSLLNVEAEADDFPTVNPIDEVSLQLKKGEDDSERELQQYSDMQFLTGPRDVTRGQRVAARRRSMMV